MSRIVQTYGHSPSESRWRKPHNQRMTRSLTLSGTGPNVPIVSRQIPVPDAPAYPILSFKSANFSATDSVASVLDVGSAINVTAGEVAIALAAKQIGISCRDTVLFPAYHCTSMINPIMALGATPRFYRLREDLSVDLDDLDRNIDSNTRVVVVVHYFGFPQNIGGVRRLCDDHNLLLLEDCAHSFFGECEGKPLGSYGDYAIASYWKFFPVLKGGCLVSARKDIAARRLRRQSIFSNLKTAVNIVEHANYYGRLKVLEPIAATLALAGKLRFFSQSRSRYMTLAPPDREPAQRHSATQADLATVDLAMTAVEQLICRHISGSRIARLRRRNYCRLLLGLADLPGCRPLFAELPPNVVPYLFPMWVEHLDDVFPKLEDAAVPMQRFGQFLWRGVEESTCPVSFDYSHHVIQLPCHQELEDIEVDWLIEQVRSTILA